MVRTWRRIALVALTAGAAIAAQLAAVAPAQAAGPAITIAATSRINPVPGYVLVEYRGGTHARARIHGTITGAAAGEVATLYAQPFPYAKAPAVVGSTAISAAAPAAYSFMVTPTLATRYKVELFAGRTATRPLATSRTQIVYVTEGGTATGLGQCDETGQTVCHVSFQVSLVVPSSALRFEMSKRWYAYFGLRFGPNNGHSPAQPDWLYLDAGHPGFTPAREVSADEFERTVTFSFTIGNHSTWSYAWLVCPRDTLSQDGLGLPGHHGCGSSRIRRTIGYLG